MNKFIVATEKLWNVANFNKYCQGEQWLLCTDYKELVGLVIETKPKYIFFPHWSWLVTSGIYENYECVIFHMTDLPFGRGAEPLQYLISSGLKETMVSAIKCVKDVDAGDIYMKRPMSLHGSAEEIYIRCSDIMIDMIKEIVAKELKAEIPQIGEPTLFTKRTVEDCRIPDIDDLSKVYDWIRMNDAESYPSAFLETDKLRLEFTKASLIAGCIEANVKIRRVEC